MQFGEYKKGLKTCGAWQPLRRSKAWSFLLFCCLTFWAHLEAIANEGEGFIFPLFSLDCVWETECCRLGDHSRILKRERPSFFLPPSLFDVEFDKFEGFLTESPNGKTSHWRMSRSSWDIFPFFLVKEGGKLCEWEEEGKKKRRRRREGPSPNATPR